jgi:hypothetical protein
MDGIVAAYPSDRAIHVVLDNLNTHNPRNDRWLKRHPNVHFHFTPTRASWLNQVEIWFSILQGQSLRAASFDSIKQLREHIDAFIEAYSQIPRPSSGPRRRSTNAASKAGVSANYDSGASAASRAREARSCLFLTGPPWLCLGFRRRRFSAAGVVNAAGA